MHTFFCFCFVFFQRSDLVFDLTWFSLELDLVIVKTNFITKFHDDPLKNEASILCTQSFSVIWPSDLVFEPTLPVSDLVLDIIHRNIWMKFQKYSMENEAYSVCTRFFLDYTYWPSFLPEVAHIWTWPKHWQKKTKHSDKLLWTFLKKWSPYCVHNVFQFFDLVT